MTTLAIIVLVAGCSRSAGDRPSASLTPRVGIAQQSAPQSTERYATIPQPQPPSQPPASQRVSVDGRQSAKGGGSYKIGKPYSIGGIWYVPQEDPNYDRTGIASWYGVDFHGRKTANGEIYDMNALTAAHPTLPIPSYAYVTSQKTGRTVLVRINDRGPYAKGRVMDLSRRTAEALGVAAAGISEVRVKYAGRAPLDGNDSRERQYLDSQPWSRELSRDMVASAAPAQSRGPEWRGRMGLMR
jgi:rare lipoprotein A (peptidoglycan hydrolase)